MTRSHFRCLAFGLAAALSVAVATPATATIINLQVTKDATLFESATGLLSGGGDECIFVGRTEQAAGLALRRGLIEFDVSTIPANATINSVSLKMFVTKTAAGAQPAATTLHRLTGDWGEGSIAVPGEGGAGATAQNNDATWRHQFRPNDPWTTAGGDFVATSSASTLAGALNSTTTWSSPGMVADAQAWLANPASNFGWLIRGNETTASSARRFASSEFPTVASRPVLTVDYSIPVTRTSGDLNNDTLVDRFDIALFVHSLGSTAEAGNFDAGDFSGDAAVGLADLMALQRNLIAPALSPTAVPEPSVLGLAAIGIAGCSLGRWNRASRAGHKH